MQDFFYRPDVLLVNQTTIVKGDRQTDWTDSIFLCTVSVITAVLCGVVDRPEEADREHDRPSLHGA